MNVFMATLSTETNTFSPIPTGLADFQGRDFYRDDGSRHPPVKGNTALIVWRELAEADGHIVHEGVCTSAQPGGTTTRHAYETLRGMLLDDVRAAGSVDLVLLSLHGAMVADGTDDCEGDIIARVRAIAGPRATIGVLLDLHCHLTEQMRINAGIMVLFKEYPHTDKLDRAREVYALARDAAEGRIRPVMEYYDCRMVSMWPTTSEPTRGFVRRMAALEGKDGILSVSFGHGFPWGDVADVGARMLVVADGDPAKAAALARQLGVALWTMRDAASVRHDSIADAMDAARQPAAGGKPLVLADVADNAGGGAPSDSTFVLRAMVEAGLTDAVFGCVWDPVAVSFCQAGGVGARMGLRIGGKSGPSSGDPIDLSVIVRGLSDKHWETGLTGNRLALGASAWVEAEGIHVVLTSERQQTFHPDAFTGLGLTLHGKRVVVVKSIQHFHAAFAPIAREVRYVAAPGAIPPDYAAIPFTKRSPNYWPRVADPFAGAVA